jgi:AraC-like DNA-binding protein/ligand-binding sensor protein
MRSDDKDLIQTLTASQLYKEYERSFSEITGLPLTLRPVESWQLPHHSKRFENPFCALMADNSRSCAACLRVQQELAETASNEPKTVTCPAGLCDMAVPLRLGNRLVGFLVTGQVFRKKPTAAAFDRAAKLVSEWGIKAELQELREAFFGTRVLSTQQHDSIIKLLAIFAQHLTVLCNQIVVQQENLEPPVIKRAKAYIEEHQSDELPLSQVAKASNTSTFYFCKIFKKFTGVNFTEYVSRVRIERARGLLLNQNLRVSEIAFETGFQSLTHFNRVFKKINGQSPTEFRSRLVRAAA